MSYGTGGGPGGQWPGGREPYGHGPGQGWSDQHWSDQQWGDQQWANPRDGDGSGGARGVSGGMIALIVFLTVLVLALLAVVAYLFLRPGGLGGQSDDPGHGLAVASSSSTPPTPSPSSPEAPTTTVTTTPTSESETVTVTRTAAPTAAPAQPYPVGADRSGWTTNAQARCNAGDPASMIGRTTGAEFAICVNPDNGRYYYRGSSGGSGVEVDDPVVAGSRATVTNAGVVYNIGPGGMVIYEGGEVISEQPMLTFWVR